PRVRISLVKILRTLILKRNRSRPDKASTPSGRKFTSNAQPSYVPVGDADVWSSAGSLSIAAAYHVPSEGCRTASHGWCLYPSTTLPLFPVHRFQSAPERDRLTSPPPSHD